MSDQRTSNLVTAARELLRLKDLMTDAGNIETSGSWEAVHRRDAMLTEYREKRGAAWDALRRALNESAVETSRDAEDAARYRFLRQPDNAIVYAKDRNCWGEGASGHVKYQTPKQLDEAVDAARGAVKASATPPSTGTQIHYLTCASWDFDTQAHKPYPCNCTAELRWIRPAADRCYSMEQIASALRWSLYAKTGRLAIEGIIEDLAAALPNGGVHPRRGSGPPASAYLPECEPRVSAEKTSDELCHCEKPDPRQFNICRKCRGAVKDPADRRRPTIEELEEILAKADGLYTSAAQPSKDELAKAIEYFELHDHVREANLAFINGATISSTVRLLRELQDRRTVKPTAAYERELEEVMKERDHAQDVLQDVHIVLGGDGEWKGRLPPQAPPDSGDLHLDVPALARERMAELACWHEQCTGKHGSQMPCVASVKAEARLAPLWSGDPPGSLCESPVKTTAEVPQPSKQCLIYDWLACADAPADQCSICPKKGPVSEERLRNTRAWARARLGQLSGAEVIVMAIDELLERRASGETDHCPRGAS